MATTVLLPKFGNSVESSIIVRWLKQVGDTVELGEPLCEVETDKATMEVPSPLAGILLQQHVVVGDDVPVQTPIAVVGDLASRRDTPVERPATTPISPRARNLASQLNIDFGQLTGSGPNGRIIERDVQAVVQAQAKLTPLAKSMVEKGGFVAPTTGSGPSGRILRKDLVDDQARRNAPAGRLDTNDPERRDAPLGRLDAVGEDNDTTALPLTGMRRVIAERMLSSLQTTAQLTLNRTADARQLQALRKRFKESPEPLGLRGITINDLVLFAVARSLALHLQLNAVFRNNTIEQHARIQLGMAVDTPRGLLVPVIQNANLLRLRELSHEARRLADACQNGKATPDALNGGTFTVSNLGNLGIESFTPILNAPQVAILGVGSIVLKPIEAAAGVEFIPHVNLSLTINHQVIDGAPAARFLQQLAEYLANLDLMLAL